MKFRRLNQSVLLVTMGLCFCVRAADVPLDLPKPDGKPGDATKPVKVYILAGQSNMVGFGSLTGASPFNGVFLTADKHVIPGVFDVYPSRYRIVRHGIYQSAGTDAPGGARVAVYKGAYDPKTDYAKMVPVEAGTVDLGTVAAVLPGIDGPHTQVVTAFIDVPENGSYQLHAGFEDSSHSLVMLEGKEVYRKDAGAPPTLQSVELQKDKRYGIEITFMKGGSAAFWLEQVDLTGKGDLESVTKHEKEFTCLLDDQGAWSVRNDVTFAEVRVAEEGRWCPLSAASNGKFIGPELGFGYVLGAFHGEQVLLIKTAMGNRSLSFDYRPPSSGPVDENKTDKFEGLEYRLTVEGVRKILAKIDKVVPGYTGQGYEIAGFVWWQGHKDRGQTQAQYEQHLVNLIKDLRKEFNAPRMPAVIATVSFNGYRMIPEYMEILKAQMAVADPQKHPEFAGTVATVDTRGFWYDRDDSPTGTDYHYNHNAKTHVLTGDALGREMVKLLGGTAEVRPVPNKPPAAAQEATGEPTEAELAAHKAAVLPIVVDGMVPGFVRDPRYQAELETILKGERPARSTHFTRDALDYAARYYETVGIIDYDWKSVVPEMMNGTWDYYTYDPKEGEKLPPTMTKWYEVDFDAAKAGWKTGQAPFGQAGGKQVALRDSCNQTYCNCGTTPGTLWDKNVLLMRQTFDLPPVLKAHRYRIVVGGACHVKSGSNYTVYINGKKLASGGSVANRQGGQPRGAHIYADMMPELEGGKVTIAVTSSLRYDTNPSPRGHLSVNLEVQEIPPLPL